MAWKAGEVTNWMMRILAQIIHDIRTNTDHEDLPRTTGERALTERWCSNSVRWG